MGDVGFGEIIVGDCMLVMRGMAEASIDAMVTDPPAGIAFMGKKWDSDKGGRDEWVRWLAQIMRESYRVMKPGAHGLVWSLPRTSHWTATALENAGFKIRDIVFHLFGSGFPKSLDVSKAIDKAAGAEREITGKKVTFRKPQEPNGWDCTARAEFETAPSTDAAKQWSGWGTALKPAAENWILIRKPISEKTVAANVLKWGTGALNIDATRIGTEVLPAQEAGQSRLGTFERTNMVTPERIGRFPSHLLLDEEAAAMLDAQSGTLKSGASRFFYVAKASKREKGAANTHPTVKPIALMRYLIRLITPPNGTVLDPFVGSGSTGVASLKEKKKFIGIEMEKDYVDIATRRIEAALAET